MKNILGGCNFITAALIVHSAKGLQTLISHFSLHALTLPKVPALIKVNSLSKKHIVHQQSRLVN